MSNSLKFSFGNSKLIKLSHYLNLNKNQVVGFDLPAGYTCPQANNCKAYAHKITGKVTDSVGMKFRCYAVSSESVFKNARQMRWYNFDLLKGKSVEQMFELINSSLPKNVKVVRVHASGDFFSKDYFKAWVKVAFYNPQIQFFGYTKVLPYVTENKPDNFKLVYSHGGKMDNLITEKLPVAYVVNTPADAGLLPVACQKNPSDDFDFIMQGVSFALALHGVQPKKLPLDNSKTA